MLVPRAKLSGPRQDLTEQLSAVKVGDLSHEDLRMGPSCTAQRPADLRAGVEKLGRVAERVHGDGARASLVDVDGKGFFLAPVLSAAGDPHESMAVHEHEAFGPAATLLPWSGKTEEAIALVRRGGGSLVASVHSDDRGFVGDLVMGLERRSVCRAAGSAVQAGHLWTRVREGRVVLLSRHPGSQMARMGGGDTGDPNRSVL